MSSSLQVKTPLREVRLRVAACLVCIMFSIDSLNPVKVVCSSLNISEYWFAFIGFSVFVIILMSNASDLIYFSVKVFLHSILSIFFSSMEVLGKQNIPLHGPVIFTGNHMNQFVDAAIILVTNPHKIGFLVADKSYRKPIIGHFSRAVGSIPVIRPQDSAKAGEGQVQFQGLKLIGRDTKFTALQKGDKIRPGRAVDGFSVKKIVSDTEVELLDGTPLGLPSPLDEPQNTWLSYDILAHVDQSDMFSKVHAALATGQCLGIFPEGGSHDRTDLLPLKVGIAAIAFGVLDKYDVNVPIVPVGLTYFRGHRFRGRVVIEFGAPIRIDEALFNAYKESRSKGYQGLLQNVEEGMRAVLVTAPDYNDLKLLHTARRLYQTSANSFSTKQKQDLARRFAVGYHILSDKYSAEGKGMPKDILDMKEELEKYQDLLDEWGLRDYQVNNLDVPFTALLHIFLHGLTVWFLAMIPSLLLNAPVGFAASIWAANEAKKDLRNSRVKLAARDVLLSKKILFCFVAVPALWLTYALLLWLLTSWPLRNVLMIFFCFPFFSYLGVMAVEAGMVDLKDLRPAFLRLLPSFREQVQLLPRKRAALRVRVRELIEKYGKELGDIYYSKEVCWEEVMKRLHQGAYEEAPEEELDVSEHQQIDNDATSFSFSPRIHVSESFIMAGGGEGEDLKANEGKKDK